MIKNLTPNPLSEGRGGVLRTVCLGMTKQLFLNNRGISLITRVCQNANAILTTLQFEIINFKKTISILDFV